MSGRAGNKIDDRVIGRDTPLNVSYFYHATTSRNAWYGVWGNMLAGKSTVWSAMLASRDLTGK